MGFHRVSMYVSNYNQNCATKFPKQFFENNPVMIDITKSQKAVLHGSLSVQEPVKSEARSTRNQIA